MPHSWSILPLPSMRPRQEVVVQFVAAAVAARDGGGRQHPIDGAITSARAAARAVVAGPSNCCERTGNDTPDISTHTSYTRRNTCTPDGKDACIIRAVSACAQLAAHPHIMPAYHVEHQGRHAASASG